MTQKRPADYIWHTFFCLIALMFYNVVWLEYATMWICLASIAATLFAVSLWDNVRWYRAERGQQQ